MMRPAAFEPVVMIDSNPINITRMDQAVTNIVNATKTGNSFTLFTLNLDHLVKLRTDSAFRAAYARASFVSADGAPVVSLARRAGAELERTTGADLVLPLAEAAAREGLPVFLFGATARSLSVAAQRLRERYPALDIVGMEAPPMGFDPTGPQAAAAADRIAATGAKIVLVALGAPKQELFADFAAARHEGIGYLCIGAAIDFVSGEQVRAPKLFQLVKLEWLWRLMLDPRRLALRYWRCATLLAELTFRQPQTR
jgi:exopolysaccharide biosynthesis WecB/TagA/CpsF family protein